MGASVLLLAFVSITACESQREVPPAAPAPDSYHSLLARLKARDTSIDFTALRLAYAASADYAPYAHESDALPYWESMNAALERQDYRRVVSQADSALNIDYLDIRTHIVRAHAAEQLGDTNAAAWDRAVADRLFESIMASGRGTRDSPYVVVSMAEEYAVLAMTGYEQGRQSLSECRSRPCDILETTHRDIQKKRTFHFDISLPKAYLNRLHQGKP